MSTQQWLRPQLLTVFALLSTGAYASVTVPARPLIVNAYYGEAYYNNALSTTTLSQLIGAGATAHLTHLTYAFATWDNNTTPTNPCSAAPAMMTASDIQHLKAQNPNIKILISVGGANSTAAFETAISNQGADGFANACVNKLMSSFPAGYVDGIDIDWEYPTSSDTQTYSNMMASFRSRLTSYATNNHISERLLLTAAIGPEKTQYGWEFIDLATVKNDVDFFNVEFYNYAYNSSPTTESNAPISDINYNLTDPSTGIETNGTVPGSQLVMGIPFYGVHWTNVATGGCAIGGGTGTFDDPNGPTGAPPYYYIVGQIAANLAAYQHCGNTTGVSTDSDGDAWSWNDTTPYDWYEYDNPATISQKITDAQSSQSGQLGGIFAWNLQDDTPAGTLLTAMGVATNLGGAMSVTSTGLIYNRFTRQGSYTATVKNVSGQTIGGAIQLMLSALSAGVTPANNTGDIRRESVLDRHPWNDESGSFSQGHRHVQLRQRYRRHCDANCLFRELSITMQLFKLSYISFFGLLGLTASFAAADTVQYMVTVNTSTEKLDTNNPNIEFQFSPSPSPTDSATAQVTNFSISGPGALVGLGTDSGTSTGQLPLNVTQTNTSPGGDYLQGIQFGNSLTFTLTLSGTAVGPSATGAGGGTFTLDFFDNNGYLFSNSSTDVPSFTVDLNPDGSTTPTAFSSAVTYSGPNPVTSTVPEPSTCLLLAGGLIGLAASARRRTVRSQSWHVKTW